MVKSSASSSSSPGGYANPSTSNRLRSGLRSRSVRDLDPLPAVSASAEGLSDSGIVPRNVPTGAEGSTLAEDGEDLPSAAPSFLSTLPPTLEDANPLGTLSHAPQTLFLRDENTLERAGDADSSPRVYSQEQVDALQTRLAALEAQVEGTTGARLSFLSPATSKTSESGGGSARQPAEEREVLGPPPSRELPRASFAPSRETGGANDARDSITEDVSMSSRGSRLQGTSKRHRDPHPADLPLDPSFAFAPQGGSSPSESPRRTTTAAGERATAPPPSKRQRALPPHQADEDRHAGVVVDAEDEDLAGAFPSFSTPHPDRAQQPPPRRAASSSAATAAIPLSALTQSTQRTPAAWGSGPTRRDRLDGTAQQRQATQQQPRASPHDASPKQSGEFNAFYPGDVSHFPFP
eukprot:gene11152-12431_t